ncbi:MAG TPA: ABC transporter ATP-binding protein [Solirubrobacteraceae bacterium]|jgi:ABC-type polysaccharide/polyol phosphate transport system ATPase subunit
MPSQPHGAPPRIVVDSVSKTFRIPEERSHTLKERALHPLRRSRHHVFPSLQDISFEVSSGEFFGIAGRNGSGKSTMLKCLAGIYRADRGKIWMQGRLSTFIELGVGFNPDLAARDNVVLNGIMMGLSPREARARYDAVIDFAELREFEELKLKNYSSGMHVRLAFSVAIQVDADILLIDEVLAVGDAAFQQKCFDVFNGMRDEGRTIVFVTHDMSALSRFCHRAMLLEKGELVMIGEPHEVGDRYMEINFGREPMSAAVASEHVGSGEASIVEAWVEDEHGNRISATVQGRRVAVKARVEFHADVDRPVASLQVLNEEHVALLISKVGDQGDRDMSFRAGESVVFSFAFDNVLAPQRYNPILSLAHRGTGLDLIDRVEGALSLIVTGVSANGGLVDLPVEVGVSDATGVRT